MAFTNSRQTVRFYHSRRKADINGVTVWLNAPPYGSAPKGDWRMAGIDLDLLHLAVLPETEGPKKSLHVMLDPGHGGSDNGARSLDPPVNEKDLTLELSRKIGAALKDLGFKVSYTRTDDSTLTLDERSRLARKKKADLFISVHANHAGNKSAQGIETYVLPPSGYPGTAEGSRARGWQIGNRNDYHNTLLGFSIHRELTVLTDAIDRGLKRQSFFVLRETSCPAVLLEFGFLSNTEETLRMLDPDWQIQSAAAVAAGISSYAKKVDILDQSVALKRAKDAEANERWRKYLAERAAPQEAPEQTNSASRQDAELAAESEPETLTMVVSNPKPMPSFAVVPEPSPAKMHITAPPPVSANIIKTTPAELPPRLADDELSSSPLPKVTIITGTNTAPVQIDALLDFYETGKAQNP
ncbi:MAG: N-acetylmuramoyl-L-alanine amidase [Kiritimatiellae bacterium]|nr:N-acetylmuramoyl-L-alanine amidase [Kiritimatiellia bacterium]